MISTSLGNRKIWDEIQDRLGATDFKSVISFSSLIGAAVFVLCQLYPLNQSAAALSLVTKYALKWITTKLKPHNSI